MSKAVILLTNFFPYEKGEEYIESELPILSDKFEKVIIVSCMMTKKNKVTRSVPENVSVIPSNIDHSKFGRIEMLAKSLFTKNLEKKQVSLTQNMYSKYFEARSQLILSSIYESLAKMNWGEYDDVVLYSYWTYITARVGIGINNLLFSGNKKIVSRAHRYDLYEENTKLNFLPEREFIFENLDYIYPVSDNGTKTLKDRYPYLSHKIKTHRLGTKQLSHQIRFETGRFHIVSCSVIRSVKRIDKIIDAISELQGKYPQIRWTHFGAGPDFKKIETYANKRLRKQSYELKGFVKNEDILNWYLNHSAHLFINVSESEGVPVSIMEAISVGLPVVATDVGGTNEIVLDDVNGKILPANCDIQTIKDALEFFIHMDIDKYQNFKDNSVKVWSERYDAAHNYNRFVDELLK